jgi:hypothetical protein
MARPLDIDDYERSIAMVSEAEDNAVQPAVAKGRQQGIPPVGPAGGRGVEHGRVEQTRAVVAVSERLAATKREAGLGRKPGRPPLRGRTGERPQTGERSQAAERSQAEQTCNAASAAAITLREGPKARPRRA